MIELKIRTYDFLKGREDLIDKLIENYYDELKDIVESEELWKD